MVLGNQEVPSESGGDVFMPRGLGALTNLSGPLSSDPRPIEMTSNG